MLSRVSTTHCLMLTELVYTPGVYLSSAQNSAQLMPVLMFAHQPPPCPSWPVWVLHLPTLLHAVELGVVLLEDGPPHGARLKS